VVLRGARVPHTEVHIALAAKLRRTDEHFTNYEFSRAKLTQWRRVKYEQGPVRSIWLYTSTHTHTHTLTYTHIRTQYKVACAIRVNTDKIAKYVWQAMV
jgi:hypothetical protein